MIKVPEHVLSDLCEKLSIQKGTLSFLGGDREDSDGIVYTYLAQGKKMVVKLLAIPMDDKKSIENLKLRVQYANYLGEHGIHIACPIFNGNHNLYETSIADNYIFTAYIMNFVEGKSPTNEELTDELVREWGKLTGKSHRVTKEFTKTLQSFESYEGELNYFKCRCKEPVVKEAWSEMSQQLSAFPTSVEDYGFIHNDNHQHNILVSNNEITLIDFDCAGQQFFVQDITTPAQEIMFDLTGGMISPITDATRLKQFFDSFLSGYEQENHLSDFWYDKFNLFINYRRLLLYSVMEDWINTKPDLKAGMIQLIQNPPKISL